MARYVARHRIDLGRDKDGKTRVFDAGQAVEGLSEEETKQLRDQGALVEEGKEGDPSALSQPSTAGTGAGATANTTPDVPQAPPGSPPPDNAKKEGQAAAQRERAAAASSTTSTAPTPSTDPNASSSGTHDTSSTQRRR